MKNLILLFLSFVAAIIQFLLLLLFVGFIICILLLIVFYIVKLFNC
jgi:hypothetical protein